MLGTFCLRYERRSEIYLLLTTVGYVGIKFVHYKIFDPFDFLLP